MIESLLSTLLTGPDQLALVCSPTRVTRRDLARKVLDLAYGLKREGIGPGSKVAVCAPPGPATLALVLAIRYLDATAVLADPRVGSGVLKAQLDLVSPDLLVYTPLVQAAASFARPLALRFGVNLPPLDTLAPRKATLDFLSRRSGPVAGGGQDHLAVVIFTSGTTSSPRAVVHSAQSLSAALNAVGELVDPSPGLPVLAGTFFAILPALKAQAPVLMPARRSRALARQLGLGPFQAAYLTPPAWRAVLAHRPRISGRAFAGSAPVSAQLLSSLEESGASKAFGVYALTEALPVAAVDAKAKVAFSGPGDLVGQLLPGLQARVNSQGVLELDGPRVSPGYWNQPREGFLNTGDLAEIGTDGIVLQGRSKDMILRKAENIYPGLYEPALQVEGVDLAILVGVPAADGDELLVAVVQLSEHSDERAARARVLAAARHLGKARPDQVVFAPVPLSGRSNKPDRAAAAALAARILS